MVCFLLMISSITSLITFSRRRSRSAASRISRILKVERLWIQWSLVSILQAGRRYSSIFSRLSLSILLTFSRFGPSTVRSCSCSLEATHLAWNCYSCNLCVKESRPTPSFTLDNWTFWTTCIYTSLWLNCLMNLQPSSRYCSAALNKTATTHYFRPTS